MIFPPFIHSYYYHYSNFTFFGINGLMFMYFQDTWKQFYFPEKIILSFFQMKQTSGFFAECPFMTKNLADSFDKCYLLWILSL